MRQVGRKKRVNNGKGRRRKKIFYLKFSEEDPEEEISTSKPAELWHYQTGGGISKGLEALLKEVE